MRSAIVDRIMRRTPLETKLKVSNEMAFITLITELGYREDKMWTPEEDELMAKLCKLANEHTQNQLRSIENHFKMHQKNRILKLFRIK